MRSLSCDRHLFELSGTSTLKTFLRPDFLEPQRDDQYTYDHVLVLKKTDINLTHVTTNLQVSCHNKPVAIHNESVYNV